MVAKVLSSKIGELPCFEDEWHSEVHGHLLDLIERCAWLD